MAHTRLPVACTWSPIFFAAAGRTQTRVEAIRIGQAHYPERLGLSVVAHPPLLFWALWNSVKPFIDPVTKCARAPACCRPTPLQSECCAHRKCTQPVPYSVKACMHRASHADVLPVCQ